MGHGDRWDIGDDWTLVTLVTLVTPFFDETEDEGIGSRKTRVGANSNKV